MAGFKRLPNGTRLGKYEIVSMMGTGGMGSVYEARHTDLNKRVAIKTLHPDLAQNAMYRERFIREGEAASTTSHPNVVAIHDIDVQDNTAFLVMELLEGVDLKQHIRKNGPMTGQQAVDVMLPIIAGVAAFHDVGIIHRDLKPTNIFLVKERRGTLTPKVLDFGLCKIQGKSQLTGTDMVVGTLRYLPPEQARGQRTVTPKADQYSLGLVMSECLTGDRVHTGIDDKAVIQKIVSGKIDRPRDMGIVISEGLEEVMMKMVSTNPDDRYPSLYHAGRALLPFASQTMQSLWKNAFDKEPSELNLDAEVEVDIDLSSAGEPRVPGPITPPEQPAPPPQASPEPATPFSETQHVDLRKKTSGWVWAVLGLLGGLAAIGAYAWFQDPTLFGLLGK